MIIISFLIISSLFSHDLAYSYSRSVIDDLITKNERVINVKNIHNKTYKFTSDAILTIGMSGKNVVMVLRNNVVVVVDKNNYGNMRYHYYKNLKHISTYNELVNIRNRNKG